MTSSLLVVWSFQIREILDQFPVWKEYKDQKHDLFLNDRPVSGYLTGPVSLSHSLSVSVIDCMIGTVSNSTRLLSTRCVGWSSGGTFTSTTTTTIVSRPFVRDYPGEPVPEETLIHPPSWSSSNLYQLLPSTMIHSILLVQMTCLEIFLHNLFPCPLHVGHPTCRKYCISSVWGGHSRASLVKVVVNLSSFAMPPTRTVHSVEAVEMVSLTFYVL